MCAVQDSEIGTGLAHAKGQGWSIRPILMDAVVRFQKGLDQLGYEYCVLKQKTLRELQEG